MLAFRRSFLAAAVLAMLPALSHGASPAEDVRDILSKHQAERVSAAKAIDEIEELGPSAVPTVFAILARRPSKYDFVPDRSSDELLREALRAWPADDVVAGVAREARKGRGTLNEDLLAIELIGLVGDRASLAVLFDLVAEIDPVLRQHRLVSAALGGALPGILARDDTAFGQLRTELDHADGATRLAAASALGELGDGRGVPVLKFLLGEDVGLDREVLAAMGRLRPWDPRYADGSCARSVRFHLAAPDPRTRREAAIALARLGDIEACTELIEMLGDEDPRVQKGAQWALEEVTGARYAGDEAAWWRWHERELDWYAEEADRLLAVAERADRGPAVEALRVLAGHRLHRRELTPKIAALLRRNDAQVGAAAAAALARLGDARAIPALVTALTGGREGVPEAARAALAVLAGDAVVASDDAWRDRLFK